MVYILLDILWHTSINMCIISIYFSHYESDLLLHHLTGYCCYCIRELLRLKIFILNTIIFLNALLVPIVWWGFLNVVSCFPVFTLPLLFLSYYIGWILQKNVNGRRHPQSCNCFQWDYFSVSPLSITFPLTSDKYSLLC